jgi:hypothetical protein
LARAFAELVGPRLRNQTVSFLIATNKWNTTHDLCLFTARSVMPTCGNRPHLTIEQQQKTKKAIQGGAGF